MKLSRPFLLVFVLCAIGLAGPAHAMGTAFTYQGSLEDAGQPANGHYDFRFRLISTNGTAIDANVIEDVAVSAGVFTVELDFGASGFPGNFERFLEIGIRPGGSTGEFQVLTPLTHIHPSPYALRANRVTDSAITNSSLATAAVTTAKLADSTVTSAKLVNNAVTEAKLANGAVTNAKVAAGSLTMSRMAGQFSNYPIGGMSVGGNRCLDYNVNFGGDVRAGDFPFIAMQAGGVLPAHVSITALRVPADNLVQVRICNYSTTTVAIPPAVGIKLMTVR